MGTQGLAAAPEWIAAWGGVLGGLGSIAAACVAIVAIIHQARSARGAQLFGYCRAAWHVVYTFSAVASIVPDPSTTTTRSFGMCRCKSL